MEIFKQYDPVISARVLRHKNCGFVNFERLESAVSAKAMMNGKEIFPGAGPIRINFAMPPSHSGSQTPDHDGAMPSSAAAAIHHDAWNESNLTNDPSSNPDINLSIVKEKARSAEPDVSPDLIDDTLESSSPVWDNRIALEAFYDNEFEQVLTNWFDEKKAYDNTKYSSAEDNIPTSLLLDPDFLDVKTTEDPTLDNSDSSDSDDIFSVGAESIFSQSSIGASQSLLGELYLLLHDDEVLAALYPQAFNSMTVRDFQKSFRELLIAYCEDLQATAKVTIGQDGQIAQTALEAAQFIRKSLRPLITRLSEGFGPVDSRKGNFAALRAQPDPQRLERVESFLQARHGVHAPQADTYVHDSDGDDLEEPRFVYTAQLKRFLVTSTAWAKLRLDFTSHVKTASLEKSKITETPADELRPQINHSHQPAIAPRPSSVRRILESVPLLRKTHLKEGSIGLEWTCKCSHSSIDFYQELAPGGVHKLANELLQQPGVIRAQTTTTSKSRVSSFLEMSENIILGSSEASSDGKSGRYFRQLKVLPHLAAVHLVLYPKMTHCSFSFA
ncbi:hypothetical protein BDZ45DRAFT_147615 [Acephala macrosclerotiorum]|nr:hypothetical protein BDZ45DRAFT_147615 [Acephala macrosclerotiorum]